MPVMELSIELSSYLNEAVVKEETEQRSRSSGVPGVELSHGCRDDALSLRTALVVESHKNVLRLQHLHLQHENCGN